MRAALFQIATPVDLEQEANLKTNYEDWMTWIVLSLCGMSLLMGIIRGALEKV